ncbi:hypothetical protein Aple_028770 [Acrocarpospora pleiomorpha]|uniref:DUF3800 domain-containing protein n=1 Tax=Acrocarpospora pleiomorpha TaxID=90975 RepID=A0A5M3XK03_9ACTN|nr:DUF3800 domain-containing protein [Acrocarpospora pleiomorpha]GES19981.1 hypothetical protein Aple_028770 [Acrocarpospora pleiomorpha]
MAEIYMYADETGNMDLTRTPGASLYFGFGTAVFVGEHGKEIWEGLRLRCDLERRGVNLPRGLHAKDDSHATREEVFDLIATLTTNRRLMDAREALADVCRELAADRDVVLCIWDAQSAWGIQVADYGLWGVQRILEGRQCKWFETHIQPNLASLLTPWGTA